MAATLTSVIVVCVCAVSIVRGYDSMKGPPRAEKSEVRHIAKVGDEVKIVCPVHGHPAPLVTWSRGGEVVDFTWTRFRVNKRQMKIKGVVKADTGSYTCKASQTCVNTAGGFTCLDLACQRGITRKFTRLSSRISCSIVKTWTSARRAATRARRPRRA